MCCQQSISAMSPDIVGCAISVTLANGNALASISTTDAVASRPASQARHGEWPRSYRRRPRSSARRLAWRLSVSGQRIFFEGNPTGSLGNEARSSETASLEA
jgi:hypothetical protein